MTKLLNTDLKPYQIIVLLSIFGLVSTIIFGFLLYMPFLRFVIKMEKALKPGNDMREFYLKLPMPLDFRVYFFNITNPEEVQNGQKPVLKEIGPYCYDAFKEKIILYEDKENDTLTYHPYDTYFFNQTRSGVLSQDDYVTILNPLTVGIVNAVAMQRPQFMSAINKALPAIFKEENSIYLTTRVRDILFDGVRINCNVKEFAATAVCSQFKTQPAMRLGEEPNIYFFSIFGGRNGSNPQQITVYRGIKNGYTLGNVVAVDNRTNLEIWSEDYCNEYHGTDGWIFPSFLESDIYIVAPDLCRTFQANYIQDLKFKGVRVKKYTTVLGDMTRPEEQCYCPKPDACLPKGVLDMTKCLKVPILCTLPHFLEADEKLLQDVDGLQPDAEKHIIVIYFEPTTGTPMMAQRRIQFNLLLQPVKKITILQNAPQVIHPIFWMEEGVELEGKLLDKIITVSTLLTLVSTGRYICVVITVECIVYGCYLAFKDWKSSRVQPIEDDASKENEEQDRERANQQLIEAFQNSEKNGNVTNHDLD